MRKDEINEKYGLVKGGEEFLTEEVRRLLIGFRRNEYGFEGLTDDVKEAKSILGSIAVIENASLEDIMYFTWREQ